MLSMPAKYLDKLEQDPRAFSAAEVVEIRKQLEMLESEGAPKPKKPAASRSVPSIVTHKDGSLIFAAKAPLQ